uniref:MAX2 n=1 Tax=Arundo donax TaxID=35708 RepID=A0A0A9FBC9_ARUDO
MPPSSEERNPSVAPARPRSSSVSAAAAVGCAASAGMMSSVQQ